jgi:6-phosphogluconolactonase
MKAISGKAVALGLAFLFTAACGGGSDGGDGGPPATVYKYYAYVARSDDGVAAYTINSSTGALTTVTGSPFSPSPNPSSVAVTPSGQFIYVTSYTSGDISAFRINPATGALTSVTGSPFSAGQNPYSVAVDPSGKFVYVANDYSGYVSA